MFVGAPGTGIRHSSWPEELEVSCVWLPQLPLRVEVLRHPAWDGCPLVLGSGPGERKVVQICSPEAESAGIHPGLPLREVLSLCRDAIAVQPDPVRVATVLDEVLNRLRRVSPIVELEEDRIFLGLHGLRGIYHDDLGALDRAIRSAVPHLLRPRIGVAGGKFASMVAARTTTPAGLRVVRAAETSAFLAPLSVSYLPFTPELLRRLELLGLRTIAELAALPFATVQAQFGLLGARAWFLANGRDDAPIVPTRFSPTARTSLRADNPLTSSEAVFAALNDLLARAFNNPALRGRSIRQARLQALLSNGSSWERLVTFKEAVSGRDFTYRVLKDKLQLPNALPPAAVEELSVELMGFTGEVARQPSLFLDRARQLEPITEAARQLRVRYGRAALYYAMEVEPWSRIPERRWALVPCDP